MQSSSLAQAIGIASFFLTVAHGCASEGLAGTGETGSAIASGEDVVRGRVTELDGAAVADVEVVADGAKARTDDRGRFAIKLERGGELRLSIDDDDFGSAVLPVRVEGGAANVEITLKRCATRVLRDAKLGGRVVGDDGFAVELPAAALLDEQGREVSGEVEVRYALIRTPDDVLAAPGRMQTETREGLDGFGLAEVRFYKGGKRLSLQKEMRVELPMYEGHGLAEGEQVDLYELGSKDRRWRSSASATVREGRLMVKTARDAWMGGASRLRAEGCVSGRLAARSDRKEPAVNTTIRAARERGLALIQGDTGADGSFCLPVTSNDDWHVSTYYDAGDGSAYGIDLELHSSDASGMCGGDGCKRVGDVALPKFDR